jgi:hypothetical protein
MITIQDTIYMGTATPASGQGGGGSITVDQTYNATSPNAQSGTAVAEAVATIIAFTGANGSTAGSAGLVPAPAASDNVKFLKGDGTWASGVQLTSNLVTSVSSSSTDTQYPSAKLFYDTVGNIETLLAAI